jgi:hypothetical protein
VNCDAQATDEKPAARSLLGIYHFKGTPAQFIGNVYDQPDEQSAIEKAVEEFKVSANQRGRLIAQRRD